MIKLLLAEDQLLVRSALKVLLELEPDLRVEPPGCELIGEVHEIVDCRSCVLQLGEELERAEARTVAAEELGNGERRATQPLSHA